MHYKKKYDRARDDSSAQRMMMTPPTRPAESGAAG